MIHVLETVYSLPFFIGAVCGEALRRLYCYQRARWENNEDYDYLGHISRVWLAGLAAILSMGYILLTAQKTQDQTIALTRDVARCWQESYQAAKAQIEINSENDGITRQQQQLQRDYDRATSEFWKDLINPPGDLANAPVNSPERQTYGLQLSARYQADINRMGAKFDDLVNQRSALDIKRANNKLPEVTCGK